VNNLALIELHPGISLNTNCRIMLRQAYVELRLKDYKLMMNLVKKKMKGFRNGKDKE
jgi:hypothetical protein